jgi:hypothetical protein
MAFRARSLSVIGFANGFTLWHYASADDAAGITAPGYFDAAAGMLRGGDFICANLAGGASHGLYAVLAAGDGAVRLAALAPAVGAAAAGA